MTSCRMNSAEPLRGEVWFVLFDAAPPALGHEQAYPRPALVVSVDAFNVGGSDLAIILPITRTDRSNQLHVPLTPLESCILRPSVILCDQITTASHLRLQRRLGEVTPATMQEVGKRLRTLLGV